MHLGYKPQHLARLSAFKSFLQKLLVQPNDLNALKLNDTLFSLNTHFYSRVKESERK